MNSTADWWRGDFGDQYLKRNRVDWRARIPFWLKVIGETGARSAFELGVNAGWNLSAIKATAPFVQVWGEDVNTSALWQAVAAGFHDVVGDVGSTPAYLTTELAFTAGVLIHVSPKELKAVMQSVIDRSCDYVLAVEYASDTEEEVEYRGHAGKLWRRPYGKLYQEMGLELVKEWPAGEGFDNCTAWLLRKPS